MATASLEPLTDGLLALRYLFGFRGTTLSTGAIGGGCTRCDAPSIETYLAGPLELLRRTADRLGHAMMKLDACRFAIGSFEGHHCRADSAARRSGPGDPPRRRVPGQHLRRQRPALPRRSRQPPPATSSWSGESAPRTESDHGVFARRFSSAGAALASEFQVNTYTTGNAELGPRLAADPTGIRRGLDQRRQEISVTGVSRAGSRGAGARRRG